MCDIIALKEQFQLRQVQMILSTAHLRMLNSSPSVDAYTQIKPFYRQNRSFYKLEKGFRFAEKYEIIIKPPGG